jgi:GTPase Era involved in 16S rRNA processing
MKVEMKKRTDLYRLYQFYKESGDTRRARQLKSFIQKQIDESFIICFSGHFSAGKSSLINELMSDNFLPTSPVPTSANVVRLSYGEPQIDIHYHDGRHLVFTPPFDEAAIWESCKNGEEVREIQIRTNEGMPNHLEWMDTPGIDSTDPLHMANTEDAVIIADQVFYVVDYNHVLASENYQFLTTLQNMGKTFHLVISQVDKHRESELSFTDYQKSIVDSLSTWNLKPESIHFISIRDKSLKINQWDTFQNYLRDLSAKKSNELDQTSILQKLASDHEVWWANEHNDLEEQLKEQLPSGIEKEDIILKCEKLEADILKIEMKKKNWVDEILASGEKAVQSALLMPYDTRELARKFIESCQSNFKMGFFSSKSKVEQERKARLETLSKNLNQLVLTMNRQVAESLISSFGKYLNVTDSLKQQLFSLHVEATSEDIENHVEKGALATGQYILNFTGQVESSLKKQIKLQIRKLVEDLQPQVNAPLEKEIKDLNEEISQCQEMLAHLEAYSGFENENNEHFDQLNKILNGEILLEEKDLQCIITEMKSEDIAIDGKDYFHSVNEVSSDVEEKPYESEKDDSEMITDRNDVHWPSLFRSAAETLSNIDGFHHISERLNKRAHRLENRRYTIALFGAFSAGKSSFANALMGSSVLPVSPHPTTATINRIFPVDEKHVHETVVITLKSDESIKNEINQALERFHLKISHLNELETLLKEQLSEVQDSHHTVFLEAVVKGYPMIQDKLGESLTIPLTDALSYISEEQKACFVDTADIYYDCELTRQGIVLVDTPGADSINARHTDTAFRFIRNADALVYVTYYNHAFSRADQEFLIQLGRVKDTFELDKMFFVINAIDLANSASEVEDVKKYVRGRLLSFGIRQARLYGVSSLQELTNGPSDSDETGFSTFYKDWQTFVQVGLQKQAIDQGIRDLNHTNQLIDEMLAKMSLSESEKQMAREEISCDYSKIQEMLELVGTETYQSRIEGEIKELFYYVKKRIIQRYIDEFSVFFNPAVLSSQQTENKKTLLRGCLDECIQFLSFDIDQEIRATFLRTESLLRKLVPEYRKQKSTDLGSEWGFEYPEEFDWASPGIAASLKNVDATPFEATFKHYKNPKQFFEGDGKMLLRDALQDLLSEAIDDVLSPNLNVTTEHYLNVFNRTLEDDKVYALQEVGTIYQQRMNALSQNEDLSNELQNTKKILSQQIMH